MKTHQKKKKMPANWIGDGDITLSAPIEDATTVDGPRSEIKQTPFSFEYHEERQMGWNLSNPILSITMHIPSLPFLIKWGDLLQIFLQPKGD